MPSYIDYENLTWLATVIGPHGIKGAVKAKVFTDDPDYYLDAKVLTLESNKELIPLNISRIYSSKNSWVIFFSEVTSRNEAEKIKGTRLLISDDKLRKYN